MFLKKIKLAGFKSFVDPTSIMLPGNLVGVVGPNGCGKSNVADAVRWVMGEVSAKHLRSGSMADVVFNGSTARKPVGLASVEIVIDNAEGRLGGRYAGFGEIAIRRQVTREGQSTYFLNGKRCRRRDVTDVFLGTGLGPRSYAIIEQGMVSRLVEARPDELREFLEEAAGVSKYKERRRETENRIEHTRENLDRLQDIRGELGKRIAHLERQAKVAEKYRQFKQEERLKRAQLSTIHWRALSGELTEREQHIDEQAAAMEARLSEQRALEAEIASRRAEHAKALDEFNDGYRKVLDAGAGIARGEEGIENLRGRSEETRKTLQKEEEALREATAHLGAEQEETRKLKQKLAEGEPALATLEAEAAEAATAHSQAEAAMEAWSSSWEAINLRVSEATQAARTVEGRAEQLKERMAVADKRRARLEEERGTLETQDLEQEIAALAGELGEQKQIRADLKSQHARRQIAVQDLRQHVRELSSALDSTRERAQEIRGRLSSLIALQQDALGKGEGALADWLHEHRLAESPRLAEKLSVVRGWEQAVENILGGALGAVCVDGLDHLHQDLAKLREGMLTLFDTSFADIPEAPGQDAAEDVFRAVPRHREHGAPGAKAQSRALVPVSNELIPVSVEDKETGRRITERILRLIARLLRKIPRYGEHRSPDATVTVTATAEATAAETPPLFPHGPSVQDTIDLELDATGTVAEEAPPPLDGIDLLIEKVTAPWPLGGLLAGVLTVEDLERALVLRPALAPGQSLVTPHGEWLGRNWLRVHRGVGPTAGILPREREIKTLSRDAKRLQAETGEWEKAMETAHRESAEAEKQQTEAQAGITEAERRCTALESRLGERQNRLDEFRRRSEEIDRELAELREERARSDQEIEKVTGDLQEKQAERDRLIGERDAQAALRGERRKHLEEGRARWQSTRDKAHRADLELASIRARHHSLTQSGDRDSERLERLDVHCQELQRSLEEMEEPLRNARAELDAGRARHKELETALGAARRRVEELDAAVRESDQKRHATAGGIESDRARLEKTRLARQETHVRREAIEEQVTSAGYDLQALLAELPPEAEAVGWRAGIEGLERQIARLGPINLAALREHAEQSQEKERLDTQYQDLFDALATLETAIENMDRETRTRFGDTFEKVNIQLGILFPRLFGGGQARLELVGEDPLNAGVTVMARPPGKKNSTIAQLSGGEKTLTAVALVFALFELNPAPFCLLDEVDAPLDDANVYRFRDLVEEMSGRVQFVLITHNKNTMEILQQLVGVTMSEPGVSRLVSVDIEQFQGNR